MADLNALQAKYEDALEAERDDPGNEKKRAAAAAAAQKFADARSAARGDRPLAVVADSATVAG